MKGKKFSYLLSGQDDFVNPTTMLALHFEGSLLDEHNYLARLEADYGSGRICLFEGKFMTNGGFILEIRDLSLCFAGMSRKNLRSPKLRYKVEGEWFFYQPRVAMFHILEGASYYLSKVVHPKYPSIVFVNIIQSEEDGIHVNEVMMYSTMEDCKQFASDLMSFYRLVSK